ncbi:hypothetical protein HDU79_002555 [Rhizoclosmatium sp. JEL0117]|nr:hypothetical protein HDU79_002555 [Rhizoclosmatium sp. JEL0117]
MIELILLLASVCTVSHGAEVSFLPETGCVHIKMTGPAIPMTAVDFSDNCYAACAKLLPSVDAYFFGPQMSLGGRKGNLCVCYLPGMQIVNSTGCIAKCRLKKCGGFNEDIDAVVYSQYGSIPNSLTTESVSPTITASASREVSSLLQSGTIVDTFTGTASNLTSQRLTTQTYAGSSEVSQSPTKRPLTSLNIGKPSAAPNNVTSPENTYSEEANESASSVSIKATSTDPASSLTSTVSDMPSNIGLIAGLWVGVFLAIATFGFIYRHIRSNRNKAILEGSDSDSDYSGRESRTRKHPGRASVEKRDFSFKAPNQYNVFTSRRPLIVTSPINVTEYAANEAPVVTPAPKDELKQKVLNHFAAITPVDSFIESPIPFSRTPESLRESVNGTPDLNDGVKVPVTVLGAMPSNLKSELTVEDIEMPFSGVFGQNPSHPSWFADPKNSQARVYRRRVTTSNAGPGSIGRGSVMKSALVPRRPFVEAESILSYQSSSNSGPLTPVAAGKKRRNASSVYMTMLEANEKVKELKI